MDGNDTDPTSADVIRLPRDWLGPPEELVPVGSRADEARARRKRDDEEELEQPVSAEDFWSGGSDVQQPMLGPTPARYRDRRPHADAGVARAAGGDPVASSAGRGDPGAASTDASAAVADERRLRHARRAPRWPRVRLRALRLPYVALPRWPWLAAAAVAIVVVAVATVGMLGSSGGHRAPASRATADRTHQPAAAAATRRRPSQPVLPRRSVLERPSTRVVTHHPRRSARTASRARRHAPAQHRESPVAASSESSGTSASHATSPTDTQPSPPPSATPSAGSGAGSGAGGSGSSGSTGSSGSSSSSGSTSASNGAASHSTPHRATPARHSSYGTSGLLGAGTGTDSGDN